MAVDLGDRRTGLAVGDSITRMAMPARVLEIPVSRREGAELLDAIASAAEEHLGVAPATGRPGAHGELVVGLPLNMDGTDGPRAKLARAFGERIAQRTGRPVRFQDERLTSAAADWSMSQTGLTHRQKKHRRDAIAAATILQDFLNGLAQQAGDQPGA